MNLYLHFPFCRSKCNYCALHSRAGASDAEKDAYVRRLAARIGEHKHLAHGRVKTVYFGGGTPTQCDLRPLFNALRPLLKPMAEVTVEVNPADANADLFYVLMDGGVTRISFGVQSFDDAVLRKMGRAHDAETAEKAFLLARLCGFENIGVDLIAGYPGVSRSSWLETLNRVTSLDPTHASCYTLIPEPGTPVGDNPAAIPPDEVAMEQMSLAVDAFERAGLHRYEISNFARRGCECRHNMAVWRGEDYIGLGEGAYGRIGLDRTIDGEVVETVTPEKDVLERDIFMLRTREGLDTARRPDWVEILERHAENGLVEKSPSARWRLTRRGAEVCDSILAELV